MVTLPPSPFSAAGILNCPGATWQPFAKILYQPSYLILLLEALAAFPGGCCIKVRRVPLLVINGGGAWAR